MVLTLENILESVEKEQAKKSDVDTKLNLISPSIEDNELRLRFDGRNVGTTKNGESSFLSSINVPTPFFRRCSADLKKDILNEHFPRNNKKEVKLRLIDDRVRYMASSKYSIFDDVDVVRCLSKVPAFNDYNGLTARTFHQSEEYLVLRLTTKDPIYDKGKRLMYPGVHISNSEIGKSSVYIGFCLFEQICTNGMMATSKSFRPFRQRHIGKKGEEELRVAATKAIDNLGNFASVMSDHLHKMSQVPADKMMKVILEDVSGIPKVVKDKLKEKTDLYMELYGEESGLEVLSAYTEIARDLDWDRRLENEFVAGHLLEEFS